MRPIPPSTGEFDVGDPLAVLLEQPLVGIAIMQDMHIVLANKAVERLTGYAPLEIYGLPPEAIRRTLLPPHREDVWARAAARLEGDEGAPYQVVQLRHKDGSYRWVCLASGPCHYRGAPAIYLFLLEVSDHDGALLTVGESRSRAAAERDDARWEELLRAAMQGEEELRAARDRLRDLALYHQQLLEKERQGLAKEVHDGLGQEFTALKMDLSWMKENLPPGAVELRARLDEVLGRADRSLEQIRRMASQLRPSVLDNLGLGPALEWLGEDVEKWSSLQVEVVLDPPEPTLWPAAHTALFRIVQEALTNVVRHSGATLARVSLRRVEEGWRLHVSDNGCGLDPKAAEASAFFGLQTMRERARAAGGTLELLEGRAGGTMVRVLVPASPHGD